MHLVDDASAFSISDAKVFYMNSPEGENFKERMKRIRLRAGFSSQATAAHAIGCDRGTVSMWEAPSSPVTSVSEEYLFQTARAYRVRADWINKGKGDDGYRELGTEPEPAEAGANVQRLRQPVAACVLRDDEVANVTAVPMSERMLPVLTYVQAGEPFTDYIDDFAAGAADEYTPIDSASAKRLSPYSFALRVEGTSMIPDFREGDLVIIDPEESFKSGDAVVAKLSGKSRATLKIYMDRGVDARGREQFDLVPLNKDGHETIRVNSTSPGSIIGAVTQVIRKLK